MKGTKLWQEAGSPIIRGRSRRQRPFWQPWLGGTLAADACLVLLSVAPATVPMLRGVVSASLARGSALALATLPGALVGSAIGVWLARSSGWRNAWLTGALLGLALGAAGAWLLGGSLTLWGIRLS